MIALEDKPRGKCRHWKLQVSIGRSPSKKGAYRKKARNFWGTYTDAKRALFEFIQELQDATETGLPENMTVQQFCDYWYELRALDGKCSINTMNAYKSFLRRYCRSLGNLYLRDLTADHVNDTHREWLESGYKRTSIAACYRPFFMAMKLAYKKGALTEDVTEDVVSITAESYAARALTEDEMCEFFSKIEHSEPLHIALLICITCGLRRSEVLALKWSNYRNGCLVVESSLNPDGSHKDPKTKASRAEVPVIPAVATILDKAKQAHINEIGDAEISVEDCYIIRRGISGHFEPWRFTKWWSKERKKFGLEGFRLHDLRHTFATELLRNGASLKDIQALVRHANFQTTADVYLHVDLAQKRKILQGFENEFAPFLRQN